MVRSHLTIGWNIVLLVYTSLVCSPLQAESTLIIRPAADIATDAYWEYYADCDQWGVVFNEAPIARPEITDSETIQLAQFDSRDKIQSLVNALAAKVEWYQQWIISIAQPEMTDTQSTRLAQIDAGEKIQSLLNALATKVEWYQQWIIAKSKDYEPILTKSIQLVRQFEFQSIESKPAKLSSYHRGSNVIFKQVSARIYKRTVQSNPFKTTLADKLEWLGRRCLDASEQLRD